MRIGQQPRRQSAQIPLAAHVRAETDNDLHPFLARGAHEGRHIDLAIKAKLARARFVQVPEHVRRHRIAPNRLGLLDAVAPVLTWNAGVVELGADKSVSVHVTIRLAANLWRRNLRGNWQRDERHHERNAQAHTPHQGRCRDGAQYTLPFTGLTETPIPVGRPRPTPHCAQWTARDVVFATARTSRREGSAGAFPFTTHYCLVAGIGTLSAPKKERTSFRFPLSAAKSLCTRFLSDSFLRSGFLLTPLVFM